MPCQDQKLSNQCVERQMNLTFASETNPIPIFTCAACYVDLTSFWENQG
jgi:hypothetical protein